MVIFIPLNTVFARMTKKITRTKYLHQDKRLKMMNRDLQRNQSNYLLLFQLKKHQQDELMSGPVLTKVVKLYGWEVSFQKDSHRDQKQRAR